MSNVERRIARDARAARGLPRALWKLRRMRRGERAAAQAAWDRQLAAQAATDVKALHERALAQASAGAKRPSLPRRLWLALRRLLRHFHLA